MLVAISIPIFTTQLEKSREATDLANIRGAYAEVMTQALDDETKTDISKDVDLKQSVDGCVSGSTTQATLEDLVGDASRVVNTPKKGKKATVARVAPSGTNEGYCTITFAT